MKMRELITLARQRKYDLIIAVESHILTSDIPQLELTDTKLKIATCCNNSVARGVTFISLNQQRVSWDPLTDVFYEHSRGRALGIALTLDKDPDPRRKLRVLGLYLPNQSHKQARFLRKLPSTAVSRVKIIAGDFNMVLNPYDRNPRHIDSPAVAKILTKLISEQKLIDGWLYSHPEGTGHTYQSSNNTLSTSRIDRFYIGEKIHQKSVNWQVWDMPAIYDHKALSFDYHPRKNPEKGKGFWQMNISYFSQKEYRDKMGNLINSLIPDITKGWERKAIVDDKGKVIDFWMTPLPDLDPDKTLQGWDLLIDKIRTFAQTYEREKATSRKQKERKLTARLRKAELRPLTVQKNVNALRIAKREMDSFLEAAGKKRQYNIRAKHLDLGEKSHKFFWQLAVEGNLDQLIMGLKDLSSLDPGKIRSKTKHMLPIAQAFYQELFSTGKTCEKSQEKLLNLFTKALPQEEAHRLTTEVTYSEIKRVLKKWKSGKTPGPDGIPYEWLKHFSQNKVCGDSLTQALLCLSTIMLTMQTEDSRLTPKFWSEGIITTLFKKGDRASLKDYRPLSLLNSVYKLITGLINNRLLIPVSELIGAHQKGFLPGRQIFDNVKEAQCLIDRAAQLDTPLYLLLLDQEKAYDRVDWGFLWRTLNKLNLPTMLIQSIKACYLGATSRVSVNKHLTECIDLQRGVRQGDPLSCLLFNVCIEPLALLILKNENRLLGFRDNIGNRHVVTMYADDTAVVLTHPSQWSSFAKCYKTYAQATGAALNVKKTKVVGVNSSPEKPKTIGPIEVSYGPQMEKYLGIYIGTKPDYSISWIQAQANIEREIKKWKKVYLSLRQRVRISKNILYGRLWYLA